MSSARPYHLIVLVKQVPDTRNVTGEVMTKDGTMNRSALSAIFNPEDLNALEMALDFKDRYGGTVTVISMGPLQAAEILRDSLCRGADQVILLSDRKFAGADTHATSYTLKCAIDKVGQYDMVFCGRQAIDGDTAQVGPQVAEKLNIPQITYAELIMEVKEDGIHRLAHVRSRHGSGQMHIALFANRSRLCQSAAPSLGSQADRIQAGSCPSRVSQAAPEVARVR